MNDTGYGFGRGLIAPSLQLLCAVYTFFHCEPCWADKNVSAEDFKFINAARLHTL
jgi:hypothetical protein